MNNETVSNETGEKRTTEWDNLGNQEFNSGDGHMAWTNLGDNWRWAGMEDSAEGLEDKGLTYMGNPE